MAASESGRGWRGRSRKLARLRRTACMRAAQAATLAVVVGCVATPSFAAALPDGPPAPKTSQVTSVPVRPVAAHKAKLDDATSGNQWKATSTTWPTAGTGTAALASTGAEATTGQKTTGQKRARAGSLPVWVAPAAGPKAGGQASTVCC